MKKFFKTLWSVAWPVAVYFAMSLVVLLVQSMVVLFQEYYATGTFDLENIINSMVEESLASTGIVCVLASVMCILIVNADRKKHPEENEYVYPKLLLPSIIAAAGACIFGNMLLSFSGLPENDDAFQMVNEAILGSEVWLQILVAVILAPLTEELLFRGVVYKRIDRAYGFWPAAIISSLLFGALHGNLSQFIYASALGMLFAYAYYKSGKLSVCIIMHLAANAVSLLLDGIVLLFEDPAIYSIAMTVLGAVLLAVGLIMMIKSPEKQPKPLEN